MKTNRGLIIALASAGVAIAGAVVYLTTTENGKSAIKKWRVKGKKLAGQTQDLVKDARKKFEARKEELAEEYRADDTLNRTYE